MCWLLHGGPKAAIHLRRAHGVLFGIPAVRFLARLSDRMPVPRISDLPIFLLPLKSKLRRSTGPQQECLRSDASDGFSCRSRTESRRTAGSDSTSIDSDLSFGEREKAEIRLVRFSLGKLINRRIWPGKTILFSSVECCRNRRCDNVP